MSDARGLLPPQAESRRTGFTLVELLLSISILLISFVGVSLSLSQSTSLRRANRERGMAHAGAHEALEVLRSVAFEEAFARFNGTPADDPVVGPSPGSGFEVAGLAALPGDPDGLAGRIEFPGDGTTLREDVDDRDLGLPRDLDLDGNVDAGDHAADYAVLPVRIVVEWFGSSGRQEIEFVTTLVAN